MKLRLIIVEPKYQINLGYIARVAKNFGITRLYLVNPKAKVLGKSAIMFAKHAKHMLESAKICGSFDEATRGCDIVVGTTGIWRKVRTGLRSVYELEKAVSMVSKRARNGVVGIVIGRDDIGLTKEEISRCDMMTYINTSESYPVLNISHALAIILFAFTNKKFDYSHIEAEKPSKGEIDALLRYFNRSIEGKRIRDPEAVRNAFRSVIKNAQPNRKELHALISAFR